MASRLRGLVDFIAHPIGTGSKAGAITIGGSGPYDQGIGFLGRSSYGIQSSTGISITQERADTVAAYYSGVRVIAEDVAGLPLITYRQSGRNRDRAKDHPYYRLLHDSPNPETTAFEFREALTASAIGWGHGFAEKELGRDGRTVALWQLRPDRMDYNADRPRAEQYQYTVRPGTAPITIPPERIFHLRGYRGLSVLQQARETLGSAIALREYGNRVLANDARPSVVLEHPAALSDKARDNLRTSWEASHGGFSNAGRMALLEEGMTLKDFGFPPEDIQFLDSQKWQVTEIARWLRLAPHKIGDLERATFSNIEEQNIDHVTSTIRPWCIRWEQRIAKDILYTAPDLFAEHLMDALLRGKTLDRADAWVKKIGVGAAVPNGWRESDNENPLEWGDERVSSPNNTAPSSQYNDLGTLIRAGFEPAAALQQVGLPPIAHTGLVPITVTLDPENVPPPTQLPPGGQA